VASELTGLGFLKAVGSKYGVLLWLGGVYECVLCVFTCSKIVFGRD